MFNGGILAGIGMNQMHGKIYLDEELMSVPRKKFEIT